MEKKEDYIMENYDDNQIYTPVTEEKPKGNGCSIAALICGIVAFLFNPCYLPCLAAIVLGIVGISRKEPSKGMAIAGLILGIAALALQFLADLLITILSFGMGFVSFFI